MGFSIAEFLAKTYRAKCVLVGRSPFPPAEEWNDYSGESKKTARFINKMLELEALGAEFLVVPTDISDKEQVRSLAEKIEQRWSAPLTGLSILPVSLIIMALFKTVQEKRLLRLQHPKSKGQLILTRYLISISWTFSFYVLQSGILFRLQRSEK